MRKSLHNNEIAGMDKTQLACVVERAEKFPKVLPTMYRMSQDNKNVKGHRIGHYRLFSLLSEIRLKFQFSEIE